MPSFGATTASRRFAWVHGLKRCDRIVAVSNRTGEPMSS
jgi:hypothetical protein